jgi:hypothetical protein
MQPIFKLAFGILITVNKVNSLQKIGQMENYIGKTIAPPAAK